MAITATPTAKILERTILFENKGTKTPLADPNPGFSAEQVRDFYKRQHPEMTNAAHTETVENGKRVLTFKTYAGTKG